MGEVVESVEDFDSVGFFGSHGGHPSNPIKFGEGGLTVQGNTELVEVVVHEESDFIFNDTLGEYFDINNVLIQQVVFKRPGVRKIVLESVVVTILSISHEILNILLSIAIIEVSISLISLQLTDLSIASQSHNSLKSKVSIVRRWSQEIVSRQLISWVR